MAEQFNIESFLIVEGENKTLGFDFSEFGGVKAGEPLSGPVLTFIDPGSGVVAGTAEINDSVFHDNGIGKKIPVGKGALVRLDATGIAVVPGRYNVVMTVTIGDDPAQKLLAELLVTDESGEIP